MIDIILYDKVDKKLFMNDIESEVIKRIFDLYIKGVSANTITKLLEESQKFVGVAPAIIEEEVFNMD